MTEQPWFVGERAESLAILHLTRRKELEVIPISRYAHRAGYDLLVRVNQPNMADDATFAVAVKGERSLPQGRDHLFQVRYSPIQLKQAELPVCIFLFNVTTEVGFYRWLYEPAVDKRNQANLRLAAEFSQQTTPDGMGRKEITVRSPFEELSDQALQAIVSLVTRWYGAKRQVAAV